MGLELTTNVRIDGREATSRVHLEGSELVLRGAWKRKFRLVALEQLTAKAGRLEFLSGGEHVVIELGDDAEKWCERIRHPRSRAEKLGVVRGASVCVLGRAESGVIAELESVVGGNISRRLGASVDLVLCFLAKPAELERLAVIADKLAPRGAVWVLWPKGRRDFAHEDVVAAGRRAGLSITKSIGFSTHATGLRLVRSAKASR